MEFIDTPLHIAAVSGKTAFAMEMMNLKPSLARELKRKTNLKLLKRCWNGFKVRLKMRGKILNLQDKNGNTVLHLAASINHPQ
ncbi:hypothetical protein Goshw_011317, partial [Gossypium schwendimanii]|nr:hypothetical protein [Gossypium schwendimanii]